MELEPAYCKTSTSLILKGGDKKANTYLQHRYRVLWYFSASIRRRVWALTHTLDAPMISVPATLPLTFRRAVDRGEREENSCVAGQKFMQQNRSCAGQMGFNASKCMYVLNGMSTL